MSKNIKITPQQARVAKYRLNEMMDSANPQNAVNNPADDITVTKTNPTSAELNDPKTALENTAKEAKKNNINTNDPDIKLGTSTMVNGKKTNIVAKQTNESVIITKEQLERVKLAKLKENSQLIKVKDFLK